MNLEGFFSEYALVCNKPDIDAIAGFYSIPSMDMCGDTKRVMNCHADTCDHLNQILARYRKLGTASITPQIQTQMRLADNIIFCVVRWTLADDSGREILTTPVSYTLHMNGKDVQHIIASVRELVGAHA